MKIRKLDNTLTKIPEELEFPLILEDCNGNIFLASYMAGGKLQLIPETGDVIETTYNYLYDSLVDGDYFITDKEIILSN